MSNVVFADFSSSYQNAISFPLSSCHPELSSSELAQQPFARFIDKSFSAEEKKITENFYLAIKKTLELGKSQEMLSICHYWSDHMDTMSERSFSLTRGGEAKKAVFSFSEQEKLKKTSNFNIKARYSLNKNDRDLAKNLLSLSSSSQISLKNLSSSNSQKLLLIFFTNFSLQISKLYL